MGGFETRPYPRAAKSGNAPRCASRVLALPVPAKLHAGYDGIYRREFG
jgi:hypothetical protein